MIKNPLAMQKTQEMQVRFLGWEDPLGEEMATHASNLTWRIPWTGGIQWAESHGLAGYSPWYPIELDTTEQLRTEHNPL